MNKPARIAFITPRCDHYNVKLFELLAQRYEIHFYFTGGGDNFRLKENPAFKGNFKVYNLKSYRILGVDIVPGLFKLLGRPYDIFIKTIDGKFAIPVTYFISRIKKTPFIFWTGLWHHPETFFHKLSFGLTKHIYKTCEANLVYGEHIKKYLVSLGVNEEKIFFEHHAVDNEFFGKRILEDDKKKLKSTLNIDQEKVILYVGRLEECKGLKYLSEAVSALKQLKTKIVFVGTGDLKEKLQKRGEELKVNAVFTGYVPNDSLPLYYSIADVFVLPSITTSRFKEPWGFVVNEAMNQGVPVIATDAVGAAAGGLVVDGKNGFIVPEKNSDNLKEALERMLTNDNHRKMGQNAKQDVLSWNYIQATQDFSKVIEYVWKAKGRH